MFRLHLLALALCTVAIGALCVQAQEAEPKPIDIVRKAVAAHGGEKNLSKYKAFTSKYKGTIDILGKEAAINGEVSMDEPEKFKNVINLDFNGMQIEVILVYDGEKLWRKVLGKTQEITDEKEITEVQESLRAYWVAGLVPLLKGGYELSSVGEVKVKDKDAIGIRVSKKGQRDISLFFDKKTHMLVKTERRVVDTMNAQEVTQTDYYQDYQPLNGVQVARRMVIHKDDKEFMNMEITESQLFAKLDKSHFEKP